ncbi:TonB-dependent receptor [Sphingomonas gellani]|uniref:TonB-dependent receptor n=1 Tax=Sphingomonas gellani TaxID=1166340 RepID=A0A1H8ALQ7_9SPHN|nr:TonB-dependent receptor [Sphingomonas gellani]SEM70924.1 TonB-dependent receptor [Sphingomonas gellani]
MRGLTLTTMFARSASAIALATGLAMSGTALAQTVPPPGGTSATDPQQGTPQADTARGGPVQEGGATATNAVPDQQPGDIVVTGVRASLERSIAIKRDSSGIVDAISAEDIGKFPNTNVAESLQRITGVSIDRVNGEGSTVTVRGFGAQYNLVTLNGRQLATSNIVAVGGDQGGDGAGGFGRSFDFANLASEGVKTLEVYKTGRAAVPSGGIGATINVISRRPLDQRTPGLTGSIGAKASYDTGADDCVSCGDHVTPEVSGTASWSNPDQRFGVSLFGSYQKRNFSFPSQANNAWNIRTLSDFLNPSNGFVNPSTKFNNLPTNSNVLVSVPDDSRYHFSEASRERINGQGVVQFKPTDTLTITADALYAQLRESERRSTQSNWFNRPFDEVTFDDSSNGIATTRYLHETINGVKDEAFEQAYRAQKNRLYDFGGNIAWQATDRLSLALDGHFGKAQSLPDNPNGQTSTTVAFNAPVVTAHSLDWGTNGFPVQTISFNDATRSVTPPSTANPNGLPFTKGNANGAIDLGDLSGAVQRQFDSRQTQRIKEIRLDGGYDLGGNSRFDFGGNYRVTNTRQTQYNTRQVLGDWGNSLPPDIDRIAPGQVFQFCAACQFHHNDAGSDPNTQIAFRTEDATKLYNALFNYYTGLPLDPDQVRFAGKSIDGVDHRNNIDANNDNRVRESIWSVYGQVTWNGQLGDFDAQLVAGARFESTRVKALSLQPVPLAIVWQADNDFFIQNSTDRQEITSRGKYNNLLPAMDFSVDFTRSLKGRFSYSKTIARAPYGNLFASTGVGAPPRPTAIGGIASGNQNNTDLDPLTSDNFDVSLEWYPRKDVYLSAGFFDKRVHNFIGNTLVQRNLFGLRDPTSGAAGTRSGIAKDRLTNGFQADITDVNLFTYTALLQQNNGNVAAADAAFRANYNQQTRALDQGFVDKTLAAVDIIANGSDPLFNFSVNTPINNKDAEIYGAEFAGQYFLGDTGFGIAASYTLVRGNVGIDVAADPSVDQFALVGLSDTANATLIYDKNGLSARVAYNWRAKFLSQVNRDSYHNPAFTAPYGQVDMNISYDVTPRLALTFEGINLFEEGIRVYARDKINTWYESEGTARYLIGARYRF